MDIKNIVNEDLVNPANCESEPIHIPGSIQPHGFLISVSAGSGLIDFCSENIESYIRQLPSAVLGKSFAEVFGAEQSEKLQAYISQEIQHSSPFVLTAQNIFYNTAIHCSGDQLILEAEPFPDGALSLPDLYRQTGRFVAHMEGSGKFIDLCKNIADETRVVTGYDRVMIYRFDKHYNGEVIAESRREDLSSFAGQKYPHTDIPAQARELYIRNRVRMIADVSYVPVPILTRNSGTEKTNSSLDLSLSSLRSVSPIHIEYLKNMGVGATLTVSLLLDKKLWGLIACHHYSPKVLPHFTRLSALLQGHFLTSQIKVRETAEEFEIAQRSEDHLKELFALLEKSADFINDYHNSDQLLQLVNATGIIIRWNGITYRCGKVPDQKQAERLTGLLIDNYKRSAFHSASLSSLFPEMREMAEFASGIIYHSVSNMNNDCIIWLREEIVETIKWAGDPYRHLAKDDSLSRLTPRKSFELYIEEVKYKSRPWRKSELHAAESFAYSLEKYLNLNLSRIQEGRYRVLSEELKDANKELANINWISTHDLKEPIRKIQMFASMVLDSDEALSEKARSSVSRMRLAAGRMQSLIEDILSYSRTGDSEKVFTDTDLNEKLGEALHDIKDDSGKENISVQADLLPVLPVIPFQVRQLFINLISNSEKFTKPGVLPKITITATAMKGADTGITKATPDMSYTRISFTDNGIGFDEKYAEKVFDVFQRLHTASAYPGTGIGLAICKKIMENHKGFIVAKSEPGKGTTMNLYFPSA